MAAPTPTVRGTPTLLALRDGYSSKVTIGLNSAINFYEKVPTFQGYEGGPRIDQTTMFNTTRRTYAPQSLVDMTTLSMKVAYNPAVIASIFSVINQPTTITQTWRNGETLADYGYLRSFKPDPLEIGKQPEATVEIEFTGTDGTGAEQMPVLSSTPGSN